MGNQQVVEKLFTCSMGLIKGEIHTGSRAAVQTESTEGVRTRREKSKAKRRQNNEREEQGEEETE